MKTCSLSGVSARDRFCLEVPMKEVAAAERPLFEAFAPFSKEQPEAPYPVLARARREQPVFYTPELNLWLVTRYEDVDQIYAQPSLFSNAAVLSPRADVPDQIVKEFGDRQ